MKIAFLVGQFPALSETFVLNQITSLLERGHSVSIFAERESSDSAEHPDVARFHLRQKTRYESMPGFAGRVLALPGIISRDTGSLRSLNVARFGRHAASLRLPWSTTLFEGARDFDIIQCHFGALGLKAVLLRAAGAIDGKIVTAFHGEDITNYPKQFAGNIFAPLFACGDLFLPISARWNDTLAALGCPSEKIRVHRMGVDCRRFARHSPRGAIDRPLRIVTVARLVEKKGMADAIRAVSQLKTPCEFVVVGDGPLRQNLEQLASERGIRDIIQFAGGKAAAEVIGILHSADVFLAPSVTASDGDIEGLPVSIIEAMAAGLPVVATRHSGIPEIVADGQSGFLVDEHDVEGLTKHLTVLAADQPLRERMGVEGAAIAAREFDIGTLTDRLVSMYRELAPQASC
jgi:colanic acid/amylovoran biosynthesis glycosyltransferase